MRDRGRSTSAGPLGMHAALWNDFAVEVGQLSPRWPDARRREHGRRNFV